MGFFQALPISTNLFNHFGAIVSSILSNEHVYIYNPAILLPHEMPASVHLKIDTESTLAMLFKRALSWKLPNHLPTIK